MLLSILRLSLLLVAASSAAAASAGLPPSLPVGVPKRSEDDILGPPLAPEEFQYQYDQQIGALEYPTGRDPIELADAFEGDIILANQEEVDHINQSMLAENIFPQKNAVIKPDRVWTNGVIPYVISSSYNSQQRGNIATAMRNYHQQTCVKFVQRTNQRDYIHLYRGNGCSSMVGKQGGRQVVSLGNGCLYVGVIMHELMHAAGFWHEQSRFDRDSYIRINWNNILPGYAFAFQKYDWNTISHLGEPYDLGSIMHYGAYAFARDHRYTTIDALNGAKIGHIGQRGFSPIDLNKLRKLYKCGGTTTGGGDKDCTDENKHCQSWAEKGECKRNPAYMLESCKKACASCDTEAKKTCRDDNTHCVSWAERGECDRNPAFMRLSCRAACDLC